MASLYRVQDGTLSEFQSDESPLGWPWGHPLVVNKAAGGTESLVESVSELDQTTSPDMGEKEHTPS